MRPRDECIRYIVRETDDLEGPLDDECFNDFLEHVKKDGLGEMSREELRALCIAALRRNRLDELDRVIDGGDNDGQNKD